VYIEDPIQKGRYSGRQIVLGPRAGDFFVVREGLQEGEIVVSNGAFKIDSALQILAKKSMMNPEGGGPAPGHHHGSSGSAPEDKTRGQSQVLDGIPEGFRKQVDCVVAAYFQISRSLGQDDLGAAKSAAVTLSEALVAVDHNLLPHAGHQPWERSRRAMESASHDIAEASDIAKARRSFHDLSAGMIETVRVFRTSGRTPILVYHCPMAMDGAGADWLQSTAGTKNPYYGSQMFKCGSQTETLVAGSEDDSVKPNSH